MPNTKTTNRRQLLATLLPEATTDRWATWLWCVDGYSDKEYRILVDGPRVAYQYGRRGASGEVNIKTYATAQEATKAARTQWATKEAKGYRSMCGILEHEPEIKPHSSGYTYIDTIANRIAATSKTGPWNIGHTETDDHVYLMVLPAVFHNNLIGDLLQHAIELGTFDSSQQLHGGGILAAAIPHHLEPAIRAICPVAAIVGTWGDGRDSTHIATLAQKLAETLPDNWSSRKQIAEAIELAHALV